MIKRFGYGRDYANNIGAPGIKELPDGEYVRHDDYRTLDEKYTDLLIQLLDQARTIKRINDELEAIGAGGVSGVIAAPYTPHWYAVDSAGMATLCVDERDARESAIEFAENWPNRSPYFVGRVVALTHQGQV